MSLILLELFVYKVILLHLQCRLAYLSEEVLWIKDNVHRKITTIYTAVYQFGKSFLLFNNRHYFLDWYGACALMEIKMDKLICGHQQRE